MDRVEERIAGEDWALAELARDTFTGCELVDVDLTEAELTGCVFERCELSGVKLNAATLRDCALLHCTVRRCSFFAATLHGCKLTGTAFVGCELRPLQVRGGDWAYVALRGQQPGRLGPVRAEAAGGGPD